jgi:hypothetical protein
MVQCGPSFRKCGIIPKLLIQYALSQGLKTPFSTGRAYPVGLELCKSLRSIYVVYLLISDVSGYISTANLTLQIM